MIQRQAGLSLVEILVGLAIMSIAMLAMMSMQDHQLKSQNYLLFQLNRTQLKQEILGTFLRDPRNCGCLFKNAGAASFSATASTAALALSSVPHKLGVYDHSGATCPAQPIQSWVDDSTAIDGMNLDSVRLSNLNPMGGGVFAATIDVSLKSAKSVAGPNTLAFSIPVTVGTTPAGAGTVNFDSCSLVAPPPVSSTGLLYRVGCEGVDNGGIGGCVTSTPLPSCHAGDLDLGASGCLWNGAYAAYNAYSCSRDCSIGTSVAPNQMYKRSSTWVNAATPSSTPGCRSGDLDLGVVCSSTVIWSGSHGGNCERQCLTQ